jgi:hypothetical protein
MHHICPKANDMFPEYKSFKDHTWNRAILTPRQHLIAHIILLNSFPSFKSNSEALWFMTNGKWKQYKFSSKLYEKLRLDQKYLMSSKAKISNTERIKNRTHHFLKENRTFKFIMQDNQKEVLRKIQNKRIEEGTHVWSGSNNPVYRQLDSGTHHFLSSEYQSKIQKKRIENGTHHMLGGKIQGETQRRRVQEGMHHFLKMIPCIDKFGKRVMISSDIFYSQVGEKKNWEYVSFSSKEGKGRIKSAII